ncbi:flagellin [Nesterenkonia lutea]|uniref:Flagellin n=1 Tax=Nesterenkonia lutea TaxID=272919 RepID=A0ABR9JFE5_9MICC|nr:flagellin [Nesterenkonia lutea]MBE1524654.1 flagellar hook-associated protein 3 FlgL [Nesterenkonia lutea]
MSISRVTHGSTVANAQRNLQTAMHRLATVQDKAATLKEISRPSDDPGAAAEAMAVRGEQRAAEQHSRNVDNASGWLTTADSALSTATNLLHQVRDVVMSGANHGALPQAAREALAVQLDNLHGELLNAANSQYMGRSVFAGTSDAAAAFEADGAFNGVENSTVNRRVGANTSVRVDADGAAAFGEGPTSVFALVTSLAEDLRAGASVGPRLAEVDARLNDVLATQATIGAAHASVLKAENALADQKVTLEARRSGLEDADLAQVALDLQTQELAYRAALASSAKVIQPSLMDYLR